VRLPDETDAKKILTVCPLENWRRPPGRPHTARMKTIQQDLESFNLSLNEAIDVAQNRPLWRLMSTFGTMHLQWYWYTTEVNEWMNERTKPINQPTSQCFHIRYVTWNCDIILLTDVSTSCWAEAWTGHAWWWIGRTWWHGSSHTGSERSTAKHWLSASAACNSTTAARHHPTWLRTSWTSMSDYAVYGSTEKLCTLLYFVFVCQPYVCRINEYGTFAWWYSIRVSLIFDIPPIPQIHPKLVPLNIPRVGPWKGLYSSTVIERSGDPRRLPAYYNWWRWWWSKCLH